MCPGKLLITFMYISIQRDNVLSIYLFLSADDQDKSFTVFVGIKDWLFILFWFILFIDTGLSIWITMQLICRVFSPESDKVVVAPVLKSQIVHVQYTLNKFVALVSISWSLPLTRLRSWSLRKSLFHPAKVSLTRQKFWSDLAWSLFPHALALYLLCLHVSPDLWNKRLESTRP